MKQEKTLRPRNNFYEFLLVCQQFALIGLWWIILRSLIYACIFGSLHYFLLAIPLRLTVPRHHRRGKKLLQAKRYPEAIAAFQASYDFFHTHPWIDKYRFITMFTSAAIPYGEMALNNIVYCYQKLGDNNAAAQALVKLAEVYPDGWFVKHYQKQGKIVSQR